MRSLHSTLFLAILLCAIADAQQPHQPNPNQPSMAVRAPDQMRRAEPPPADATARQLEIRADILRAQKAYADALDYYRESMKRGGETAVLHNKIGITQMHLLRLDSARKAFERAVKTKSDYAEAYNNLGVLHYMQKNHRRAIRNYEKALEISPNSASFHSNLGTAQFARKEYEKASASYARALEIDPHIFDHRSQAGVALHMSSPEERAYYHYVIAKMFAGMGNIERALHYLRRSMEDGYPKIRQAYEESAFAEVRKDPRFEVLMQSKLELPPGPR